MRPLWTSLPLLLASLLHAEGYTCPSGKSKETITLAVGESVDFSTQETDTYGKNVRCQVKFKRGKQSKCKLNFSCSAFTLTAKNSNCNKGSDFMKIGKEKFCEDNTPDVTINGRTLNVLFRSNKKSKGGAGAECTATCIDTSAPTTPPTTTSPPATTAAPTTAPYKLQPEDPGCYESDCPPGCQLVLIAKLMESFGGLYYGIPAKDAHIAVSPDTRLYKSTGQTAIGSYRDWANTYYMFHHRELNMWVIGEGEDALTSLGSEKIVVQSGVSGSRVIPLTGYQQWTWEKILPYCMDMDGDNFCKYDWYEPDETSRSLTHKSYPFSENMDGKMVTQFTYKGETYEVSQRKDSEGALIYATRGLPLDLPIMGRTKLEEAGDIPRKYRVLSFSEKNGFRDIEDFDPSLAVTDRLNDVQRHIQAAAISTGIKIPASSGLTWGTESGSATSWELRMDITVTHSTNGTYFMTIGWGPGGYSGIQQSPDTSRVPSGKNFICSMWDTNTDNHGNAVGGTPEYSYVDELNEEADMGGQVGVINNNFGGEGTGQQIMIDYPWAIGDTTTAFLRGSRTSVDSDEWCVTSGLAAPGKEEVFLARFCRKSPEDVLKGWGFYTFIEDWIAWPSCPATGYEVGYMKQRAAIFSNWKVTVDGKEITTEAPSFQTNMLGYARGLTDAGMLGDNAFYMSTGGWKYDNPYSP